MYMYESLQYENGRTSPGRGERQERVIDVRVLLLFQQPAFHKVAKVT